MINLEQLSVMVAKSRYGNEDTDQHNMTIFGITLGMRAKRILELGVRSGNTTMPLLIAAEQTGGMVHSVDIDPTGFVCPGALRPFWKFHQSDAIAWLRDNQSNQYDVVYIDDWHSYAHVKQELELLTNMVSPSSVILLHDLMYGGTHPRYHSEVNTTDPQWAGGGPYRAVAELDPAVWEWSTIPVNHGLTLLRKKHPEIIT